MTDFEKRWLISILTVILVSVIFLSAVFFLWMKVFIFTAFMFIGGMWGYLIETPFTLKGCLTMLILMESVIVVGGLVVVQLLGLLQITIPLGSLVLIGSAFPLGFVSYWYLSDRPPYRQMA